MIELELTPDIQAWLATDPDKRSLQEGADLLLRVTRNRILYANLTRNLSRHAEAIEYHLQKILKQRLVKKTHAQVAEMMVRVEAVNRARGLDKPEGVTPRSDYQRGKRADHDMLPEEVQKLYTDNADIMRRMRECHTRLRMISPENSTCPDSDRFPWAKELLALDSLYRDNWNRYDHYVKGTPVASIQMAVDPRTASKNASKLCFLLLGKYERKPDDALAERIRTSFASVDSPTETLRKKMTDAGLL